MYLYKSKHLCITSPTVHKKQIIIPNENRVIEFEVYTLPSNTNIFELISNPNIYSQISMVKRLCLIYFLSNEELTKPEIIQNIETFIKNNYEDVHENEDFRTVKFFEICTNVLAAINLYNNITLYFSEHENSKFRYINYTSVGNRIDKYDTAIQYVHINNRQDFSSLCGKVIMPSKEVCLFHSYPTQASKVYLLPDNFVILKEADNKIAFVENDKYVYWLVTHHTFINLANDQQSFQQQLLASQICSKNINAIDMKNISNVFSKYGFYTPSVTQTAIVAEDSKNSILMFVGVYDLSIGSEYIKYFEKLMTF